jgi:hypothetical protein
MKTKLMKEKSLLDFFNIKHFDFHEKVGFQWRIIKILGKI